MHPRVRALERERGWRNSVRERQLCSGDVGFITWRSSSYVWTNIIVSMNQIFSINRIEVDLCKVTECFYVAAFYVMPVTECVSLKAPRTLRINVGNTWCIVFSLDIYFLYRQELWNNSRLLINPFKARQCIIQIFVQFRALPNSTVYKNSVAFWQTKICRSGN